MKKKKALRRDRSAGGRILKAASLCLAVLLAAGSCDKLFIPGDVPDGPSALTLTSEAGERTAEPLSYYWIKRKTDERTEEEGPDPLTAEYDPLVVQPGETIRFTFADGGDPYTINLRYYESDRAGGYLDPVDLYPLNNNNDPGGENPWEYSAPEEDGLLVAEAFWPVWVNTGISAEVTYAFYVWSAKG